MLAPRPLVTLSAAVYLATSGACTGAREEFSGSCPPDPKTCDGRCVARDDPAYGCGADSCSPCAFAGGTAACSEGACALAACLDGFGDCDESADNGCEASLDTPARCGACDVECALGQAQSACVDGQCAVETCEDGFEDCDGEPDNGCEADLSAPEHCGSCAYDCLGGACSIQGSAFDCGDIKMYTGADALEVFGIAVDDSHLYFATGAGSLLRIPKDATEVDPLGPEVETIIASGVGLDVAVDASHVYWATFGGTPLLFRAAKEPDATPELVDELSAGDSPAGVARSGPHLYWGNLASGTSGGVWRVDVDDLPGMPQSQPYVTSCPSCDSTADVALGARFVCWTQLGGGTDGVHCREQAGGNILTRPEVSPRFVAMEGERVYWTSSVSSGALRTALATGLQVDPDLITGLNEPTGVAVDELSLYVSELNGRTIRRKAKPPNL